MNLICISSQNWYEGLWTNKQHIMNVLSRFNRILYFNPEPLSFRKFLSGSYSWRKIFSQPRKNLFILPLELSITGYRIKLLDQLVNFFWKFILKLVVILLLPRRRILWVYPPESSVWLGVFNELIRIYDCVDDYSQFPVYREKFGVTRLKRIERELVENVDLIFTTSAAMFMEKKQYNPQTYLVKNVAEFSHFNSVNHLNYLEPMDLRDIPHPRLLFIGAISSFKLDFNLISRLSRDLQDHSIILIGPRNTGELATDVKDLEDHSNIYFLGSRAYSDLPGYIKYSDVLILPYVLNDYTRSCFPIKFFEYLATGKPVVTTAIPELKEFKGAVSVADDPEEFIRACKNPDILEQDSETRISLAHENMWETRIGNLVQKINNETSVNVKFPTLEIVKGTHPVRIGIDARLMYYSRMGIGEYVENLVNYLKKLDNKNQFYLYFDQEPQDLELPSNFKLRVIPMGIRQFWIQRSLPKQCEKDGISLLHSPVNFEMPITGKFKKVVTVHDLVPIKYPAYASGRFAALARLIYPHVMKHADLILTDSINSKKDIESYYPRSQRKVEVVYLGLKDQFHQTPSPDFQVKALTKFNIQGEYILNTGGFEPRKNTLNLVRAFKYFSENHPDVTLVIVGKFSHTYQEVKELISELKLDKRIILTGFVSESELISLYFGCKFFIYPSYYEGFGFPPLEAMSAGKPVIVSLGGSLPEIIGDAGLYVNPDNPLDIQAKMNQLYSDQDLYKELTEKGSIRIKQYTWEDSIRRTHEYYLKLAG